LNPPLTLTPTQPAQPAQPDRAAAAGDPMRLALERNELALHYLPTISLPDGRVVALEALMRWRHPERGMLVPAEFMPAAVESGAIVALGAWALETVCAQLALWRPLMGGTSMQMSVNVSSRELREPGFATAVAETLARHAIRPGELAIEVTESLVADGDPATVAAFAALDELGVQLAVDDFGTGHASLAALERFPADLLKIDGRFVAGLGRDGSAAGIVSALVMLGHALGLRVVAEGVERREQLSVLREMGCDLGQGFLFAAPAPPEDIARLLALAGT
jgi:EAL domain-containing protein (putative c-di-GMP-specific phosphodiesterase class I)